jgi:hypothetical protein
MTAESHAVSLAIPAAVAGVGLSDASLRRNAPGHEWLVERSLLIFFNVPGTHVTQGESCLDVVLLVQRHHGIVIFYRSGDLRNPAFGSIVKDHDKRGHLKAPDVDETGRRPPRR